MNYSFITLLVTSVLVSLATTCEGNIHCTFEVDFCGWTHVETKNNYTWLQSNNSAVLYPDMGRPYIYINVSYPQFHHDMARIETPEMSLKDTCVQFMYLLSGPNMGHLKVYLRRSDASERLYIWTKNESFKSYMPSWKVEKLDLRNFAQGPLGSASIQYVIGFEAMRRETSLGRIAVANVQTSPCGGGTTGEDCSNLYTMTPRSFALHLYSGHTHLLDCYKELNTKKIRAVMNRLIWVFKIKSNLGQKNVHWAQVYNHASNLQFEVMAHLRNNTQVLENMKMWSGEPDFSEYNELMAYIKKKLNMKKFFKKMPKCKEFMPGANNEYDDAITMLDKLECATYLQKKVAKRFLKNPDEIEQFIVDGIPRKLYLGYANLVSVHLQQMHSMGVHSRAGPTPPQ